MQIFHVSLDDSAFDYYFHLALTCDQTMEQVLSDTLAKAAELLSHMQEENK